MSQVVCLSTLSYEALRKENYDRQGREGGRRKNNHASELIQGSKLRAVMVIGLIVT